MVLMDEVQCLRALPFFASADPAKLKLLAFTSDRMKFAPGQELFHEGDTGDSAFVILSGTAEIVVDTPSGEVKVAEAGKNSIVGEIAILCDGYRTATVRAIAPMDTLRIDKETFRKMMADCPSMMFGVMRVLANRLQATTSELAAQKSHEEEYA
ncbi:cyclic nucleotide-binding protein (plasmid) [Rhizobium sp. ACO-34A]|nr:Crp/Fnr family transcriptional regulator [Rhizobium sp. ACO-34A]ATN37586.1 cyclic nucleotide-binding protein [Rhizobium sp. ACO-34A]